MVRPGPTLDTLAFSRAVVRTVKAINFLPMSFLERAVAM
jgi:hypothetical protein